MLPVIHPGEAGFPWCRVSVAVAHKGKRYPDLAPEDSKRGRSIHGAVRDHGAGCCSQSEMLPESRQAGLGEILRGES